MAASKIKISGPAPLPIRGRPELSIFFLYANSIQGRNHPPTPMLSAILRLLSHLYGPLYACNNLKLVYLCTLEALEIKKLFDCEEKYGKINHFKVVCY